jgi:O-antigen/teichoic acid export membrane protein
MEELKASYVKGSLAVGAGMAASVMAGFVSLYCLTRILEKEAFGGYGFAATLVAMVSIFATGGLERAILLKVGAGAGRRSEIAGGGLVLKCCAAALILCGFLVVAMVLGADALVARGVTASVGFWLPALALSVLPITMIVLLRTWLQSNHRVPLSVSLPGMTDALRSIGLVVTLLFGLGVTGVVGAVYLSVAFALGILLMSVRSKVRWEPSRLTLSDLSNGTLYTSQKLVRQRFQQFDILILGLIASGAVVAEYLVAARLAQLGMIGTFALSPSFMPRARRLYVTGSLAGLIEEYHLVRLACLLVACGGAAAFAVLGGPILSIFGSYHVAYGVLLILSAAMVVNMTTAIGAQLLTVTGEVRKPTAVQLVAFTVFAGAALVLGPRYGGEGVALAVLIGFTVKEIGLSALIYRHFGAAGLAPWSLGAVVVAAVALCAGAVGVVPPIATAGAVGFAAGLAVLLDRHAATFALAVRGVVAGVLAHTGRAMARRVR